MKLIQTLVLSALGFVSLGQNCETFFSGQFEPVEQRSDDSVFYLVTLSQMYEFHSTLGYRNLYDLVWYDHCSLRMEFTTSSAQMEPLFDEGEKFECNTEYLNDSLVSLSFNDEKLRLKRCDDLDIMRMMMSRDYELKKVTHEAKLLHEEYERTYGKVDSLSMLVRTMIMVEQMMNQGLRLSAFERESIGMLFSCLRSFDVEKMYSNCSSEFIDKFEIKTLRQYLNYVEKVYGKWESFSVLSQSVNGKLLGLPVTKSGEADFSFKVKFENFDEPVKLSVSLSEENDVHEPIEGQKGKFTVIEGQKTLQSINIDSAPYEGSTYLDAIGSSFYEHFHQGNYSEIYAKSSELLKKEASSEQIVDMLRLANSMSEGTEYEMFKHAFYFDENYGGLIVLDYVAKLDDKNLHLSLFYGSDSNEQLMGINFKEKRK